MRELVDYLTWDVVAENKEPSNDVLLSAIKLHFKDVEIILSDMSKNKQGYPTGYLSILFRTGDRLGMAWIDFYAKNPFLNCQFI